MLSTGTENAAPEALDTAGNTSTSVPPPPSYGSAPPSYGAYQGPPQQQQQQQQGGQGNAPPYGAPQGNRPPPAYAGGGSGGGRGANFGGSRRGWGGQGQAPPPLLGSSTGTNPNAPASDANSDNGNAPSNDSNGDRNEQRDANANINQAKYKTRICQNFLNGNCSWGNNCAFAHGDFDRRLGSPSASNSNAPNFGAAMGNNGNPNGNYQPEMNRSNSNHPGGMPPPSYDRSGIPPPYTGGSPHKGQRTPPPMVPVMNSNGGGFPVGGANYAGSPISPRSPIKLSSPTGTGQAQRFRYEPYGGLGKAFSSDNLQGMASGAQSPREPKEVPPAPSSANQE